MSKEDKSKEEKKERLPFEPRQNKKKNPKKPPVSSAPVSKPASAFDNKNGSLSAIPKAVSDRMVRRMTLFSGIPTVTGMLSFVIFYFIVSNEILKIPTQVVVFVSIGLFGLGVVGLSYGILSTSWDENRVGGRWGFSEFKLNFGRMTNAWRAARKEAKGE